MAETMALPETAHNNVVRISVRIHDSLGLHARPAARLAQEALRHQSQIILSRDGLTADAKSILDILSLAAAHGSTLDVICSGPDARQAAAALELMFQGNLLESAE